MPYPSSERLIGYWLCAHPSFVRLICVGFVPCLCERLYLLERGVVYSRLLYCPKSSVEISLCGKSCVDKLVEILLCEGGDVELYARTSKHICVLAIDPLSLNSLFYFEHCILLPYHIYACVVCVCLTCV